MVSYLPYSYNGVGIYDFYIWDDIVMGIVYGWNTCWRNSITNLFMQITTMTKIDQLRKCAGGAYIHLVNKAEMYSHCWNEGSWCIKKNEKKSKKIEDAIDKAIAGNWAELQELLKNLW